MEKNDTSILRFMEEMASTGMSDIASDVRNQINAYSKVRGVLQEFRSSGVRTFELPNLIDRYESELAKTKFRVAELDFILRKENVEIQIEVKCHDKDSILLTKDELRRYRQILGISAKTQEILIVWVNEDMPTLAIDLSKIQKYNLSMKEDILTVEKESLQPLREAISNAFDRHMPVWLKPSEISILKGMKYDVRELFKKALNNKIQELKTTRERRRYLDRKQAIGSITEDDIEILNQIFNRSQLEEITEEQIEDELMRLSK